MIIPMVAMKKYWRPSRWPGWMSVTSAMPCETQQLLVLEASGPEKTAQAAAMLARQCRAGDCILLQGDVGSGKTTFARAFIRAISPTQDEIVSPTFTLV